MPDANRDPIVQRQQLQRHLDRNGGRLLRGLEQRGSERTKSFRPSSAKIDKSPRFSRRCRLTQLVRASRSTSNRNQQNARYWHSSRRRCGWSSPLPDAVARRALTCEPSENVRVRHRWPPRSTRKIATRFAARSNQGGLRHVSPLSPWRITREDAEGRRRSHIDARLRAGRARRVRVTRRPAEAVQATEPSDRARCPRGTRSRCRPGRRAQRA